MNFNELNEKVETITTELDYNDWDKKRFEKIKKLIPNCKNGLDVGCKDGYLTNILSEKAKKTKGIDLIDIFLKKARKNYSHIKFVKGDINTFKFKEKFGVKDDKEKE